MGKLTDAIQQKSERAEENLELFPLKEALTNGETKRLNCDVPTTIYKKLQIKVIEHDSTITETINRLVIDYLSREA